MTTDTDPVDTAVDLEALDFAVKAAESDLTALLLRARHLELAARALLIDGAS